VRKVDDGGGGIVDLDELQVVNVAGSFEL